MARIEDIPQPNAMRSSTLGVLHSRFLPADLPLADLLVSHVSINFDRSGYQRDINTIYPIERLRELTDEGIIGGLAPTHYAVMGSTDPVTMEDSADQISGQLRQERIDAVLLSPVRPVCTRAMSALAHMLETRGTPTVAIGLVRPQMEKTRPPRGL